MRPHDASWTARWVAWMRALAAHLPDDERLATDPLAAGFTWPAAAAATWHPWLGRALVGLPPLRYNVLSLQLRTRAIDDAARAFVARGGRQVVLLGAGFDARASRLALGDARFFEVDHPATQADKRARVRASPARFVAWDFERRPLAELPAALAAVDHDAAAPTLTIWEGVTMYLSRDALDGSARAIRAYSAPGSDLVFNYFDAARLRSRARMGGEQLIVSWVGEPFRSGFEPTELGAWLRARGFELVRDRSYAELARELLPRRRHRGHVDRRLALATVVAG